MQSESQHKTGFDKFSIRFPSRSILGVRVDDVTLDEAVALVEEWALAGIPRRVVTANPEYVMAARGNPQFRDVVNTSALVTPDGVGLIYAGKLLKQPFRQRVTGVALTHALSRRSAETGLRLFLLGAAPGVAEEAAQKLRALYPGVNITGCFAGQAGPEGDADTTAAVRQAQAQVVLVAYGMVKQDYWSLRNLQESGASVSIGVGGVFDYLAGRARLAPLWMRRAGLEWLYRLATQPQRWRRILVAVPWFGSVVLLEVLKNKVKTRLS
jgi:N-acetylglucosaminyldiphosphoundecaprenol N-acetyl-beta-D-mannosaminyltransferase